MSDNIPLEIQMDIILRIPDIKSVIRCRSVSKAWKSMIDGKDFVAAHTLRHQANRHLLIRTLDWENRDDRDNIETQVNYVSIIDDDTFPHQKVSVFVPDSVHKFSNDLGINQIIGSSHGLLCLYEPEMSIAVIWNPSIRKTVDVAVPNVFSKRHLLTVVGFGICPRNLDPKLVKITFVNDCSRLGCANASTQVEVFTLSSGWTWRSPLSSNLPHKSIEFGLSQAVVDGFIYWKAVDRIDVDDQFRFYNIIMSFDLTTEEFTKVNLPGRLYKDDPHADLALYNLRESLAVLEFYRYERKIYHVWMMIGHGCSRSFNMLYSIHAPDASIGTTLGFLKNGAPIVRVKNDKEDYCNYELVIYEPEEDYYNYELAIYEPESESNTKIGLFGTFFVHSYMETLLLLGH